MTKDIRKSLFKNTTCICSIFFIYRYFFKPFSKDEDLSQKEIIVNSIFFASTLLFSFLYIIVLYKTKIPNNHYGNIPLIPLLIAPALIIFLHLLFRQGKDVIALYGLMTIYVLGTGYGAYNLNTGLSTCVLIYAFIIIVSSILIGTRFTLIVTTSISVSLFLWLDRSVTVPDILIYISLFLIMQLVLCLSNREIKRSNELQKAHKKKVDELYRFAEFGRLSSGIFHDLMNPLSAVTSYVNLLHTSSSSQHTDNVEYINKAIAASKRMEQFISSVRKQISVDRHSYDTFVINNEIEEIIALLHYKASKVKITINFYAPEKITTHGNAIRFNQIITNVICNAMDSYDDPLAKHNQRIITVCLKCTDGVISISIQDRGCGIPPQLLGKIFDPFFTTKTHNKGMGLGLSTTKEIVEKDFEGKLTVESIEGQGSTFKITFPQKRLNTVYYENNE